MKTVLKNLKISDISQIYQGKDNACRCGCKGTYVASSFMLNPRSDVDDKKILSRLERAIKLVDANEADIENNGNHINVSFGNDRAITIYLDELKF